MPGITPSRWLPLVVILNNSNLSYTLQSYENYLNYANILPIIFELISIKNLTKGTVPIVRYSCLKVTFLLSDLADALYTFAVLTTFSTLNGLVIQQAVDGLAGRAIVGIAKDLRKLLGGKLLRQQTEALLELIRAAT